MRIYLEPVNLRQWNLFDNVKGSGHVECFLATRDMQLGDIVILHVGKQDPAHESDVYAYGTVIYGPYILENRPTEYCNNKLTVDVRIDHIVYDTPIITHEQCKRYTGQYRNVHVIADSFNDNLKVTLGIQ